MNNKSLNIITSGSDSSESNCNDVFPVDAENAAKNLASTDPRMRLKKKA